jgi:RNA polymerase sigma factor (sigma-70 family)
MAQLAARLPTRLLRGFDDERLARLVEDGNGAAFEVLYDRHHRPLLAFCRHMLGNREDGEDALQQTFVRAHRALREGKRPDRVRPWLFAIARNRCRTMFASRAAATPADEVAEPSYDGLSAHVRRRAELRQLVADVARLPADQREALVLFELGGWSQTEIASVIGCAETKVKALVFQARSALIAERDARDIPCRDIQAQLDTARGGVLRRGPLRRHLRQCAACEQYRLAVARQRGALALILPVAPSAGLKTVVLGGAGATAAGGAAVAVGSGIAIKALATKVAVTAALAGAGAGGGAALMDDPGGLAPVPGPPPLEQAATGQAGAEQAAVASPEAALPAAPGERIATRPGDTGELSTPEPKSPVAKASAVPPGVTAPRPLTRRRRAIRPALGLLGPGEVRPPRLVRRRIRRAIRRSVAQPGSTLEQPPVHVRRRIRRAIRRSFGQPEPTTSPRPRRVLRRLLRAAPPDAEPPTLVRPRLRRQQPAAEPVEASEPASPSEPEALAEPTPEPEAEPQTETAPEPVAGGP